MNLSRSRNLAYSDLQFPTTRKSSMMRESLYDQLSPEKIGPRSATIQKYFAL